MGFNAEKWLTGNSQFSSKDTKDNKKAHKAYQKDQKRKKEKPTMQERKKRDYIDYGKTVISDSKKGSKQYDWKTEMLGDLSIKSYGRSYEKKFDKWTDQQGITSRQEKDEFRKYLDYREQEKKAFEKREAKKHTKQEIKDGIDKKTDSIRFTPWEQDDAMLKGIKEKRKARAESKKRKAEDPEYQADKAARKAQRTAVSEKGFQERKAREANSRDGVLGFLDKTLGRVSDKVLRSISEDFTNQNDAMMERNARATGNKEAQKMMYTQTRKANGKLEKAADLTGTLIGETAPYMLGAYGVSAKALGAAKNVKGLSKAALKAEQLAKPLSNTKGIKKMALQGAEAGAVVGTGKSAIKLYTDEYDEKDAAKRIALETSLGAAGDVGGHYAIKGIGKLVVKLRKGDKPVQEVVEAHAKETGQPVEEVQEALARELEEASVTGEAPKPKDKAEEVLKQLALPAPKEPVKPSSYLKNDPWLGFAQQGKPKSRPMGILDPAEEALKRNDPKRYEELYEKVADVVKDPAKVAKLLNTEGTTHKDAAKILEDLSKKEQEAVLKARQEIEASTGPRNDGYDEFRNRELSQDDIEVLFTKLDDVQAKIDAGRQARIDADPSIKAAHKKLKGAAQAIEEFEVNKQLKEEGNRIIQTIGQIRVPKANYADWWKAVPPRFRAPKDQTGGDDLYKAAEDLGFENPDELIKHLQNIDKASKKRLKDIRAEYDPEFGLNPLTNPEVTIKYHTELQSGAFDKHEGAILHDEMDKIMDLISTPIPKQIDIKDAEEAARQAFRDSDFSKEQQALAEKAIQDAIDQASRKPGKSEMEQIYAKFKTDKDPESLDKLVDVYAKLSDTPKLKRMLDEDPRIKEGIKALTAKGEAAPTVEMAEEIIEELPLSFKKQVEKSNLTAAILKGTEPVKPVVPKGKGKGKGKGKKGKVKTKVKVIGKDAPVKSEAEAKLVEETGTSEVPSTLQEGALRLNIQAFDSTPDGPLNPIFSMNPGELKGVYDDKNLFNKLKHSLYEGIIDSNHKFDVVSKDLESNFYKNAIAAAKQSKDKKELKRLKKEFRAMKVNESGLVKSAQNEKAAYLMANDLIERTVGNASVKLKEAEIPVADAFEYQTALNLDYQIKKGGHADYTLPAGWDEGRLVDVINRWRKNEPIKVFVKAMDEIRTTRLDFLQNSGLKSSEEYAALAKNPYYLPLQKDHNFTGMEANYGGKGALGSAAPNVKALGKGDVTYFDNPMESLISATYVSIRNSLRNSTHTEIAKLAELDTAGRHFRQTDKPVSDTVIEFYDNGVPKKFEVSKDMARVIEDMRKADPKADIVMKASSLMAGLKTTSVSYQAKAIPRDFVQAAVNMDGNPFKNMFSMIKALGDFSGDVGKELSKEGAAYHNAFKEGMGSYDTATSLSREFVNSNRAKGGKDEILEGNKAVKTLQTIFRNTVAVPYRVGAKIGNVADNAPRFAQLERVDKQYKPVIADLQAKIAAAQDPIVKDTLSRELAETRRLYQQDKIYKTRDVINYQRGGGAETAKAIKKYVNFANTATQSVDKFFREYRKKPLSTTLKVLGASAPLMAAQELNYRHQSKEDQQLFDDTPAYLKNTMYIFPVNGKRIMIPKPFEVAILTSPFEAAINATHKENTNTNKEDAFEAITHGLQEILPLQSGFALTGKFSNYNASIVAPAAEAQRNEKDFNEKPISYGSQDNTGFWIPEGKTQDDVSGEYTSPVLKKLAGDKVNADYLDYLIKSYGGDTGKLGLAAVDVAADYKNKDQHKNIGQTLNPLQDFANSQNKDEPDSKLDGYMQYLFRPSYVDAVKRARRDKE